MSPILSYEPFNSRHKALKRVARTPTSSSPPASMLLLKSFDRITSVIAWLTATMGFVMEVANRTRSMAATRTERANAQSMADVRRFVSANIDEALFEATMYQPKGSK